MKNEEFDGPTVTVNSYQSEVNFGLHSNFRCSTAMSTIIWLEKIIAKL